jgi:hypothetical protein
VRGRAIALVGFLTLPALAQTPPQDDFFVRPPQLQAPQAPGQGGAQPPLSVPGVAVVSVEMLVKQGFEVKAVSKTSDKATDYLVILQRSGELRTCLMRLGRGTNRALKRDSVCF